MKKQNEILGINCPEPEGYLHTRRRLYSYFDYNIFNETQLHYTAVPSDNSIPTVPGGEALIPTLNFEFGVSAWVCSCWFVHEVFYLL
jgi:hypothetical protein